MVLFALGVKLVAALQASEHAAHSHALRHTSPRSSHEQHIGLVIVGAESACGSPERPGAVLEGPWKAGDGFGLATTFPRPAGPPPSPPQ